MMIISCDVAWNPNKSRNAIAVTTDQGEVKCLAQRLDDAHLVDLVCKWSSGSRTLVLLDVPIEGCRNLAGPRRPIENALQHYISLYPASRSANRGEKLKKTIMAAVRQRETVTVKEIYPHAVYKFLWAAREKGKLPEVNRARRCSALLDGSFTPTRVPPGYKGRQSRDARLRGLRSLRNVLIRELGLKFTHSLEGPRLCSTPTEMETLTDLYDACLGAVAGWYCAIGNPYAWLAGDEKQGEMLLLSDLWLKTQLESRGLQLRHFVLHLGTDPGRRDYQRNIPAPSFPTP